MFALKLSGVQNLLLYYKDPNEVKLAFNTFCSIRELLGCLIQDWGNYEWSDKYTYIIKCGTKDKYR